MSHITFPARPWRARMIEGKPSLAALTLLAAPLRASQAGNKPWLLGHGSVSALRILHPR